MDTGLKNILKPVTLVKQHLLEGEDNAVTLPSLLNSEGLWAGQGTDISDKDLATARAEMWNKFDREKPDGGERSETEDELNEEIANS